jgi:hypothetical protein
MTWLLATAGAYACYALGYGLAWAVLGHPGAIGGAIPRTQAACYRWRTRRLERRSR